MRAFVPLLLALTSLPLLLRADDLDSAKALEKTGDSSGARQILERAAASSSAAPEVLAAYAEFLDRHRDPAARQVYARLVKATTGERAIAAARRLVLLDLIAGDREGAARNYSSYRSLGGNDLAPSLFQTRAAPPAAVATVEIPGPLPSFARMAALSPDLTPEELLPALARNIITNGYQASAANEALDQTEYLKLIVRYISQARELSKLAASNSDVIKIDKCESPETADLLRILGYRMRGGCGSDVVLETVNATRAFLTIDSGFPLSQLEQALRTNRPFAYDFQPTKVPVLYTAAYWMGAKEKQTGEFIDMFLGDPALCRLYLGLAKLDGETATAIRDLLPAQKLKAFAHVLDFYGAMFQIRNGAAVVPGGERAAAAWADLSGKHPREGAAFFERLLTRDDGWMASFYESLARISPATREYLTDSKRMNRFYTAMRGRVTSPGPARPVFRASTDLMLLTQRLRLDPDGRPHIPGGLEVWKNLFVNHPHGKYDGKLTKAATGWKEPDDLLEALFALCRKAVENEPLRIYMTLSDLNRFRSKPLETATVDRLARSYREFGSQYSIFSEAPEVSDKTILQFLASAESINDIGGQLLKADAAGTMQALVGLWQIFARQGSIAPAEADASLQSILASFAKIRNSRELFDAGRTGVKTLLTATNSSDKMKAQDRLLDLLAGTGSTEDSDSHRQIVEDMIRIVEAQRLLSIDDIFAVADIAENPKGERNSQVVARVAARIAEIRMPRAALSGMEKNSLAFGYWTEKHVEQQRKVNLRALLDRSGADADKPRDLREALASFLRDTLVGLNYVHYAPPGAQILTTNPLFIRTHDFLGVHGAAQTWRMTEVFGSGWPSSAGGRLVGSLSSLPYALAEAEQNFLIPSREQALIWGDLVPQLITTAKVSRWWNVTPSQLQWVALHMGQGESLVAEAAVDPARRSQFIDHLSRYAPPARTRRVVDLLEQGKVDEALGAITPSETFLVAVDWLAANKNESGIFASAIRQLTAEHPAQVRPQAISRAFGTSKPTLTGSYRPELLQLRTFPTLMGFSSRIMAESWESNLLYYAALAHDIGMQPSQLNLAVPLWTQQTVENIFATHLEDWPALLRSLRMVGDDVRAKYWKQLAADQRATAAVQ